MRTPAVNDYEGCVEKWKINLALSRIKAFRFPQDQWSDLLQTLVLEMASFRYCAEHAGGRNEAQTLYGLINHRLRTVIRSQQREQRRMERHRELLGVSPANAETQAAFAADDHSDRQLDIQLSLAALPEQERQVCKRLMVGDSVTQIARDLGIGWHAVAGIIRRVRAHFTKLELDAWLQK